jgi:hypothetical protein
MSTFATTTRRSPTATRRSTWRQGSAGPCFGRGVAYGHAVDYERAAAGFERVLRLTDDAEIRDGAREQLRRVRFNL